MRKKWPEGVPLFCFPCSGKSFTVEAWDVRPGVISGSYWPDSGSWEVGGNWPKDGEAIRGEWDLTIFVLVPLNDDAEAMLAIAKAGG